MSVLHPTNEQEVIYNFIQMSESLGLSIESFWTSYPDASAKDAYGILYRIEFEYKLSSFIKHGHDPRDCDLVVCWKNDVKKIEFPVTVWELSTSSFPQIYKKSDSVMQEFLKYMDERESKKRLSYSKRYLPENIFKA